MTTSGDFFDDNGQAGALKAGLLGFGGSGKTYTGILLAVAVREALGLRGPVAMFDTESGSLYVKDAVQYLTGQPLLVKRGRAADSMIQFGRVCQEREVAAGVVDSITHPWRELCESALLEINRQRAAKDWNPIDKLEFQHWGPIKAKWQTWSDFFLNTPLSLIICGRAGFEYDFEQNENGRKELVKTGVKMKTEGEMGYEPSLLVMMEAEQEMQRDGSLRAIHRTATVLKDRFRVLDARTCQFRSSDDVRKDYEAVKEFFGPHLQRLGRAPHTQVDTQSRSRVDIAAAGDDGLRREMQERDILRDEIQHLMTSKWPGQTAQEKRARMDLLAEIFGRPSWTFVETLNSRTLREGRDQIAVRLGLAEPPPRVSREPETAAEPAQATAAAPAAGRSEPFEGFTAPAEAPPAAPTDTTPASSQTLCTNDGREPWEVFADSRRAAPAEQHIDWSDATSPPAAAVPHA